MLQWAYKQFKLFHIKIQLEQRVFATVNSGSIYLTFSDQYYGKIYINVWYGEIFVSEIIFSEPDSTLTVTD